MKTHRYYRVMHLVLREADLEPLVIYKSWDSDIIWSRPLVEFTDGRFVKVVYAEVRDAITAAHQDAVANTGLTP